LSYGLGDLFPAGSGENGQQQKEGKPPWVYYSTHHGSSAYTKMMKNSDIKHFDYLFTYSFSEIE
jgi:hypothetical protein